MTEPREIVRYAPRTRVNHWLVALGFVLAVYVFYAFLGSLGTLFEHDALERERQPACGCAEPSGQEDAS